jgi:hypothetical protein
MRVTVVENDSNQVTKFISHWGDKLSPMSPFGAVAVTIPTGAFNISGANITVSPVLPARPTSSIQVTVVGRLGRSLLGMT